MAFGKWLTERTTPALSDREKQELTVSLGKIACATVAADPAIREPHLIVKVPAQGQDQKVADFLNQNLGLSGGEAVRLNPDASGNTGIIIYERGLRSILQDTNASAKVDAINAAILKAPDTPNESHAGAVAIAQGIHQRFIAPLTTTDRPDGKVWSFELGTDEDKRKTIPSARLHLGTGSDAAAAALQTTDALQKFGINASEATKGNGESARHLVTIDLRSPLHQEHAHKGFQYPAAHAARAVATLQNLNKIHGTKEMNGGWQVGVQHPQISQTGQAQLLEQTVTYTLAADNEKTAKFMQACLNYAGVTGHTDGQTIAIQEPRKQTTPAVGVQEATKAQGAALYVLLEQATNVWGLGLQPQKPDGTTLGKNPRWSYTDGVFQATPLDLAATQSALAKTSLPYIQDSDGTIKVHPTSLNSQNLPLSLLDQTAPPAATITAQDPMARRGEPARQGASRLGGCHL